ncbi:nucleotidyltransferase domain-containing protein [Nocardioides mesophilus]|uniref:Nucleotidyltransferase domain-containing protein n=1 Tax=Nocardioides mesophilus TaxID=433659 RepID=A0A7G9RDZ8_9ACTN|nr:nucleotidyltransferase domain-containing protein [Nocardioides mesophilus]QNN53823.1 nucleotidyltransferase domain-containing protein [Nocardioides mesophilus]
MYGDRPEPLEAAASFVGSRFPQARAAFLGGSVLTAERTPTSDLDVVVLLAGPPAPYRETFEHERWTVEAFVHTRQSLDHFWALDAGRRVCSLLRMCALGAVLTDPAGIAPEIAATAAARIAAGPPALDAAELDAMRYRLTDLLDDLAGCDVEDELVHLAGAVLQRTAELALATAGRWSGGGKALARALRDADPDLAERLVDGHRHVVLYGDTAVLHRAAVEVLLRAGGPLLVGYRLKG